MPPPIPAGWLAVAILLTAACAPHLTAGQDSEVERICGRNPFLQMKQLAEQILGRVLYTAEFNTLFNRALNDKRRGPTLRRLVARYQDCRLAVENGHF